jgi:spore coat protein H
MTCKDIGDDDLSFEKSSHIIENRIEIFPSKNLKRKIELTSGKKFSIGRPLTIVNGDTMEVEKINIRGKTTLYLRRKSFTVSLEQKAILNYGENQEKFKKFYAISLSMDKNYIRNRLAFGMLREIGLFDLFFSFSEFRINNQSEGIYLLMERPQDWALKKMDSPLIIRRGYEHKMDKIRSGKNTDKHRRSAYIHQFREMYKILKKYDGELLYEKLSGYIDLEQYMEWLAFNFLVRNGDYTDEVYFYIDPVENRFKIIPWDYDDIFASQPHEGKMVSGIDLEKKLIFSGEDMLDHKIVLDPFLYNKYLLQFYELTNQLTPVRIKHVFEQTYQELYPYFNNKDIISMSMYDTYGNVSLESLESDLRRLFNGIIHIRFTSMNSIHNVMDSGMK